MLKSWLLCSLILASSAFAKEVADPQRQHICQATHLSMAKFEETYMPGVRDYCVDDDDCAYLSTEPWKFAIGINKVALAGYHMMIEDTNYKKLAKRAKDNCSRNHPHVIVPLPESTSCVANVCMPTFSDDSRTPR